MSNLADKLNQRILKSEPDTILKFDQKVSKIPDLIKLTLGEPDFNTPEHIKNAMKEAIDQNKSHYTDSRGIFPLRQSAADFLNQKYDLNYDPKTQIIVTSGVSEGLKSTLSTILNPGDSIIVPTPAFPIYSPDIKLTGANPIYINTSDNNFKLSPKKLADTIEEHKDSVKAVLLCFPNNPTGVTYNAEELKQFAQIIKKYDLFCISDEIYSELVYDQNHVSMGNILPQNTIVLNGVSKSHAMTGYRIGIICGPKEIIEYINIEHELTISSVNSEAQYGAMEAFKNGSDDTLEMKQAYQQRQKILGDALNQSGFKNPVPEGAFYIFAKIPEQFEQNSFEFAYQLAKKAHIGVIPGAAFGPGGEGYLRFSYAASLDQIKEAAFRIQEFTKKHK